jgi:hypothetical protein
MSIVAKLVVAHTLVVALGIELKSFLIPIVLKLKIRGNFRTKYFVGSELDDNNEQTVIAHL